jgi:hypothetical protein
MALRSQMLSRSKYELRLRPRKAMMREEIITKPPPIMSKRGLSQIARMLKMSRK